MPVAKYQAARLRTAEAEGNASWSEVLPSEISDKPAQGDLRCVGCDALVKHTSSSSRRKNGTEVPAYFSLYPGGEHAVDCTLDIATVHVDGEDARARAVPLNQMTLFLHIPDEERLKNLQPTSRRVGGRRMHESRSRTLASAATIADHLRRADYSDDELNTLELRYRDHRGDISVMHWADFCFEARSVEALKYLRRLERDGELAPPVAVKFPRKFLDANKAFRFRRVDTFQRADQLRTDQSLYFSVAEPLDSEHHRLADFDGEEIIVLARGTFFEWGTHPVTEVRFVIEHDWQIAAL